MVLLTQQVLWLSTWTAALYLPDPLPRIVGAVRCPSGHCTSALSSGYSCQPDCSSGYTDWLRHTID